jgi:hypothetical protein
VNADFLALLTSILETTSGQQWPGQWRTRGPEVWPRIRAMIRTRRTATKGSQVGEKNKKKEKDSLVNDRKGEASTQKAQSGPKESEARKKRRGIASFTEDRRRREISQEKETNGKGGRRPDAETGKSKRQRDALADEYGKHEEL